MLQIVGSQTRLGNLMRTLAFGASMLVASHAFASGTEQLKQFVSQVHSARGEFVQTEVRAPSNAQQQASGALSTQGATQNKVSSGTFTFARPGKFIWNYEKPYAQLLQADGDKLYIYDKDVEPGRSACTGKCADAWPPLMAPASATGQGEWTIAARPDGTRQWSFLGKPVYAFAQDKFAGATLGDGVQDVWHVAVALAPRPREVVFQGTVHGRVAATLKGRTLYTADHACTGTCLHTWTPLAAPTFNSQR